MSYVRRYEYVAEKTASYNVPFIDKRISDSSDVARFITEILQSERYTVEKFMVFMLDTKLKIQGYSVVSIGSLDSAPVHPREVFAPAVSTPKCAAIIVAHNHPSGDATASSQDIDVTDRLRKAGEIIGIRLIDHVIVGDRCFTSMKSEGYL